MSLLRWVLVNHPSDEKSLIISSLEQYISRMNRLVKDKGLTQVVAIVKRQQLHVTRFLSNEPLYTNDLRIGLTYDGLPKDLRGVLQRIRSRDPSVIRAVLTITSITRVHLGDGRLNPSSIIEGGKSVPHQEDQIIENLENSKFWSSTKKTFEAALNDSKWKLPHLSTKAGPNGQAMGTSLRDLEILPQELKESIYILGGKSLKSYMRNLSDSISTVSNWISECISQGTFLRRLSVVQDKALKNRPIAILDYWSQTSLICLHKSIMRTLRTMSNDMTYDQLGIEKFLGKWESYHSLDLTAATDRFPVSLQRRILSKLTTDQYAQAWEHVMVGYPFSHKGSEYRYSRGQPMGAYSSWAMFALSHHVIIQHAASLEGINPFRDYAVLGDDVVIGHRQVAENYKQIIKNLDVEISEHKSHEGNTFVEFAKNSWLFIGNKSVNVSGVPLPGILEGISNPYLLSQELSKAIKKSTLAITSVPVSKTLLDFFGSWMSKRSSDRMASLVQEWWRCDRIINWVKDYKCNPSPNPIHCNHKSESSHQFLKKLLMDDLVIHLEKMNKDLIAMVEKANHMGNTQYDLILDYHNKGPDRDDLPNLGGIFSQPWYQVMEDQVSLVDQALVKIRGNILSKSPVMEWEEIITMLSQIRISDPSKLDSRRTAAIVSSNKRRQSSLLLPYVRM